MDYGASKKKIEELVTFQMTYLLDGRVVDFFDHNRATAKALGNIIKNKGKFPKDEFARLKNAFPCILAGIRDYAEYIPLAPEIFALVIIDEASQVSVAQAFPALLRAKKVIVLDDKKQFSNVTAAQARSDTNKEYLNNLERSFRENVSHIWSRRDSLLSTVSGTFNLRTKLSPHPRILLLSKFKILNSGFRLKINLFKKLDRVLTVKNAYGSINKTKRLFAYK